MTIAMLEGVLFPDVRTDGKRRYARIEGGCLVDVAYLPDVPTPEDEPATANPSNPSNPSNEDHHA